MIIYITKYTTGAELCKGDAFLVILHRNVGMCDRRRGEEDECACRKLDDELQVPEDEMPAFGGVELAKCLHGAPAKREVEDVAMFECPNIAAEVERGAKEDRMRKWAAEVRVANAQLRVTPTVVVV